MADIVSCAFKSGKFFKAAANISSYFNTNFPLPQKKSWTEYHPPTTLCSLVLAFLRGKQQHLGSLLKPTQTGKSIGATGRHSLPSSKRTHSLVQKPSAILNVTSLLAPLLHLSSEVFMEEGNKLKFPVSLTPSPSSKRPSSWLKNPVPCTAKKARINSRSTV